MRAKYIILGLACAAFAGSAAQSQDKGRHDDIACMLMGSCLSPAELKKAIAAAQAFPLGSKQNPIRSDMPPGERAYLSRLRCSDGKPPEFSRSGSVGTGPYGGILDLYQLRCSSGQPATAAVYVDMYHPGYQEAQAVPGFTIVSPQ